MAIVVEKEQKGKSLIVQLVVWVVVLGVLGAALYYIFFKRPELVEITVPASFRDTEQLSQVKLSPAEIIQNPGFQALRPYITPLVIETQGRDNPFR